MNYHHPKVHPSAQVHHTAYLGHYTTIGSGVIIKANAQIGNYVHISQDVSVGENSYVDNYANIADCVTIGKNVTISNYVSVGTGTKIKTGCILNNYTVVAEQCIIEKNCLLKNYSTLGHGSKIGARVYIGEYSVIPSDVMVDARAIIHRFVEIPRGAMVQQSEVVIRAPPTEELYQKCAPINRILDSHVEIASYNHSQPSNQFNLLMRVLLDAQINTLRAKCEQVYMAGGHAQAVAPDLATIKSLYLIQRYGLQSFKNTQSAQQADVPHFYGQVIVNGQVYGNDHHGCDSDSHFGENSESNIFEPDVKKKLIQLLAIEEDASREHHAEHETFSSVAMDILNGQREVTVVESSGQSQNQVIFNGVNVFNGNAFSGINQINNAVNQINNAINGMNNAFNGMNNAFNGMNNAFNGMNNFFFHQ